MRWCRKWSNFLSFARFLNLSSHLRAILDWFWRGFRRLYWRKFIYADGICLGTVAHTFVASAEHHQTVSSVFHLHNVSAGHEFTVTLNAHTTRSLSTLMWLLTAHWATKSTLSRRRAIWRCEIISWRNWSPALRRKAATDKLLTKATTHEDWGSHGDITDPSTHRLSSRRMEFGTCGQ